MSRTSVGKNKAAYRIGQVVEGEVTGIQPYGIFVRLDATHQGLIHISEVKNTFVTEIDELFTLGSRLTVKIIDIDEYTKRLSLSLRALHPVRLPKRPPRLRPPRHAIADNIGFQSLRSAMPTFIKDALRDIERGKIKDYRLEE
ncbi:MAG: CvfD/Ygs/GSP13 family RNA-binding post-transcriptional regulator [Aerococcus sp.]|nr:CvfD/Ygs/GSP13 family RNA-binding post-transcriptional regulator [Aerococcus sp.]